MNTVTHHNRHEIVPANKPGADERSVLPGDMVLHCYDTEATGTVIASSGNTYAVLWAKAPKRRYIDPFQPVTFVSDPVDSRWTSTRRLNDYEYTMSGVRGAMGYTPIVEELFDGDEQYAPNTFDGSHLNALQQEGARLRFCDDGSVVASYRDVPRHRLPARVHANPHRVNRWLP